MTTGRDPRAATSRRDGFFLSCEGGMRQMRSIPSCFHEARIRQYIGRHRTVILPVFSAAFLSIGASPAWSEDRTSGASKPRENWQVTLGAGPLVAPDYEGSDEFTVFPIPLVSISWKDRIFLNLEHGLGVYAFRTDSFRIGVSVGYARGRDQDDSDRLRGLGDIDDAARGHLFARYSVGLANLGLDLSRDFGGTDGFQVRPSVGLKYALSKTVRLSPEISATWANDDYMQTYFGISSTQAGRSGLPRFDADAGFKRADLKIAATWDITDGWFTTTHIGLGYLLGDAADSPIADRRLQPSIGLFIGYKF